MAIILREIIKAKEEASSGFVNVTSPLAMATSAHTLPFHDAQRTFRSLGSGSVRDNAIIVAIETSQLEDGTAKVVSITVSDRTM